MQPQEDKIRDLAHRLWEKAGQPHGRHDEFWLDAERAVREDEAEYDKALADSFPASDPPGNSGITGPEIDAVKTAPKRSQALRTKSTRKVGGGDDSVPKASKKKK